MLQIVAQAQTHSVFVGIPPQSHIVKAIAGDTVEVQVLLKPGSSPATYNPSISQLNSMAQADAYFLMGLPFEEKIIGKIQSMLPNLPIVDTRSGIPMRHFGESEHHEHDSEEEAHHEHEVTDPHCWMSPDNLQLMAQTILRTLEETAPENADLFKRNYLIYCQKLEQTKVELQELMQTRQGLNVAVYHPAYGYLFDYCGIRQLVVEQMGKEPTAKALIHFAESIRSQGIQVMLLQQQFSARSASILSQQTGIRLITVNPLAEDAEDNFIEIIKALPETNPK